MICLAPSPAIYFLYLPFYKYNAELPLTLADESADVAELQYKTGTIHHDLDRIVTLIHSVIIILYNRTRPLGTSDVCTKFHGNSFSICQGVSLWTKM